MAALDGRKKSVMRSPLATSFDGFWGVRAMGGVDIVYPWWRTTM